MPDPIVQVMLLVAAFVVCGLGFAWIALAMDVHWAQVRGTPSAALPAPSAAVRRGLRGLGAASLLSSLLLCLRADHAGMAALVWVMALAVGALAVAFTLSWRPRLLAPLVAWVPAQPTEVGGRAGPARR